MWFVQYTYIQNTKSHRLHIFHSLDFIIGNNRIYISNPFKKKKKINIYNGDYI